MAQEKVIWSRGSMLIYRLMPPLENGSSFIGQDQFSGGWLSVVSLAPTQTNVLCVLFTLAMCPSLPRFCPLKRPSRAKYLEQPVRKLLDLGPTQVCLAKCHLQFKSQSFLFSINYLFNQIHSMRARMSAACYFSNVRASLCLLLGTQREGSMLF